ncbi:PREDICTED: protein DETOXIFICATION 16-like [Lupinus angustifolius]|uniref:protein DETOXIFICATION 16-like n=1 Tax=Lupinus angustifolius TaxID=3871 RepID=UPI00092ECB85|nr:PREDICTED: protein DETOXIFICATION 16-like [Lupinus angustifolius]
METQENSTLHVPMLPNQHRSNDMDSHRPEQLSSLKEEIIVEVKKQLWLGGPLVSVSLLQYSLQMISIMFVGHLGNLPLSGASLGSSFASVSGYSILLGMGSALETLCGQAYGARQYHMLGIHTQRAMLVLIGSSIPLSLIWFYTSNLLILMGQDHEISAQAGIFNRWMIPGLFAFAILQCLNKFLQSQNNVFPLLISSGVTTLVHVVLCWFFVFQLNLGSKGAALAISISYWINVFMLVVYINLTTACAATWNGISKEALNDIISFIKLAMASAVMICFEYWSFEMVVLLSGLLPNPQLETSVLSISLNTCWMVYNISVGLGCVISSRVSNELGAGNAQGALLALRVMMVIAILVGTTIGLVTILVRNVWGKLYSNEDEVIKYVAKMMPLLALSDFLDGFQCVLSGAARGCGWQNLCVGINFGAYYVVGIPTAILFAFVLHIGGMGLWMGIICGLAVQGIALVIINLCTDWDKEARKAVHIYQNSNILT